MYVSIIWQWENIKFRGEINKEMYVLVTQDGVDICM